MVTTDKLHEINSACNSDHQDLYNLIRNLRSTSLTPRNKTEYVGTLAKIIRKSHLHFIFEEALFDKHEYANIHIHKDHHRQFIHLLDSLYLGYLSGENVSISKIAQTLIAMVDEHNQLHDKEFRTYISQCLENTEYAIEL